MSDDQSVPAAQLEQAIDNVCQILAKRNKFHCILHNANGNIINAYSALSIVIATFNASGIYVKHTDSAFERIRQVLDNASVKAGVYVAFAHMINFDEYKCELDKQLASIEEFEKSTKTLDQEINAFVAQVLIPPDGVSTNSAVVDETRCTANPRGCSLS